jgi:hypothetical protein
MTGTWNGNQGVLDERFTYSDGKTERRVWRLTDLAERPLQRPRRRRGRRRAGQAAGNALNWRYTLALPVDGKVYEVQFDDWMYLMDDGDAEQGGDEQVRHPAGRSHAVLHQEVIGRMPLNPRIETGPAGSSGWSAPPPASAAPPPRGCTRRRHA